ncbi:MAG: hypothetical protein JXB88_18660 [Spirochaetales bacterium]|nr:hypothetical protein [Spirochaetales bacterium]
MKANKCLFFASLIPGLLFSLFFSCGKGDKSETGGTEYAINKEYTSGPCTLVIKITKQEITIAESITMIIDVTVDKEYNLRLPEFGENLEQFKITGFHNPGQKLVDNKRIAAQQEYVLEPFLSGTYTIPVIRVAFWTDAEDPEDPHILESEEFTITVTSLLDEDMEKLTIKDITGPVIPAPPDYTWLIILIIGIIVIGREVAGLIFLFIHKKRRERPVITIPAHELAFRQLEALINRNYIEKGEFKLFYINISTILRHYIENRFMLHAPEQTTEEFLYDLQKSDSLQKELKDILKEFLFHCDMVKFAKYVPKPEEIQKTFDTCRNFIVTTEDVNARIQEPVQTLPQATITEKEVG